MISPAEFIPVAESTRPGGIDEPAMGAADGLRWKRRLGRTRSSFACQRFAGSVKSGTLALKISPPLRRPVCKRAGWNWRSTGRC